MQITPGSHDPAPPSGNLATKISLRRSCPVQVGTGIVAIMVIRYAEESTMSALKMGGRMLRWGMLPIAAALVLALGASPADADRKRHKHWNHGGGGHSQHWGNGGWGHGGWGNDWRPRRHHRQRHNYYNYYYAPAPNYYYPPPAYYYPRPRYYNPYGGSFSFGLTVPFD
jgi:hypothetical protein